jgi:hypothetical protein
MPREFEPREFEPLDLEAVDLVPVDLEPVDLRDLGETRAERPRRGAPGRIWVALAGAAIVVGAVVALTHRGTHARPTAAPAATDQPTTPATRPAPTVPVPAVERITRLAPSLRAALRDVGSGHFAVIVDDRLYVIDHSPSSATRIPLPEGHVTIDDQNGASLLVSTFEQTLVSTQPISTRTLSARDFAIKAYAPDDWWLLRDDGTIRADHGPGSGQRVPEGLRPAAAVQDGFVALDTRSAWVVWSPSGSRPIAQVGDQLLATRGHDIAFKSSCAYSGCALRLLDVAHGTQISIRLSKIPEFAAFSPDGTRVAVATTTGDAFVVDTTTGAIVTGTRALAASSPSVPFTWTPDGRELLVVQDHDIQVVRASDGVTARVVRATDGVEQIAALP